MTERLRRGNPAATAPLAPLNFAPPIKVNFAYAGFHACLTVFLYFRICENDGKEVSGTNQFGS